MDIEQVITLGLALFLAVKYIFFEQVEMESTLSLKVPTPSSMLSQKWSPDQCCRKEVPCSSKPEKTPTPLPVVTKEERGIPSLPFHFCVHFMQNHHSIMESNSNFSHSDLVIRPLPAPKEPEHKSTFVLGEDETREIADVSKPVIDVPAEPRPVEDCLSILKNPDVRVSSIAILFLLLFFLSYIKINSGFTVGLKPVVIFYLRVDPCNLY